MRFFRRLSTLLRRCRDRDLAEEMRFHQEQQQADGLSPAAAERAFGNDLLLRERSRDAWGWLWLEQLSQDLRQCGRQLRRSPSYAALAILILALGIGANTALFSVIDAALLRPLPYPHPEQIVTFDGVSPMHMVITPTTVTGDYAAWVRHFHAFQTMATYEVGEMTVETNAASGLPPERVPAAEVSPDFFKLFGTPPSSRGFQSGDDAPGRNQIAVLSHQLAQRFGGANAVIGQAIRLNSKPFRVAGVMPTGFDYPSRTQVWVPLPMPWNLDSNPISSNVIYFAGIARLRPGVTPQQARAELIPIAAAPPGNLRDAQASTTVARLDQIRTQGSRPVLWLLLGAVGLVLLIACANVANLQLTRAVTREKEIAVRVALGAGRGRLARQNLTESLALALLGGAGGCLLAGLCLPALRLLLPAKLPLTGPIALDGRVLAFALAATLAGGLFVGLAPTLHAFRTDPNPSLKGANRHDPRRGGWLRAGTKESLAVTQIALALVLLAGAGLLIQSLWRLTNTPLGFNPSYLLTADISMDGGRYQAPSRRVLFYHAVLQRVAALPGVTGVALGNNLPLRSGSYFVAQVNPNNPEVASRFSSVSTGYFHILGIPLLAGRDFTDADRENTPQVVIVNHALAAALWPGSNPIGQRIPLDTARPGVTRDVSVVGEVGDTHLSLGAAADNNLYFPLAQSPSTSALSIIVRGTGDLGPLAAPLRRAVASVDPDEPLSHLATMDELASAASADPRFRAELFGLFAALALILSVAGLGGVLAYAATQRTHEIGVRMALGAQPAQVLRMVLAQGLWLMAIGIAVGLAGALALAHLLTHLLYGVSAYDPTTLAAMAALMAVISAAACWWPARRAARVNPVVALRRE